MIDVEHREGTWVTTTWNANKKRYIVRILNDGEVLLSDLRTDEAVKYASSVLWAVAYAEHDAAVWHQLHSLVDDTDAVEQMVRSLQADRPALDLDATAPFAFVPGLARTEDRRPVIQVRIQEKVLGVWDPDQARDHALAVIESTTVAELDSAYLRALRGQIGLPFNSASGAVAALIDFRRPPAHDLP